MSVSVLQRRDNHGAKSEASFNGTMMTSLTASTNSSSDADSFFEKAHFAQHLRFGDRLKRWYKHTEHALFSAVYAMAQENAFRVKYSLVGQFIDFLQLLAFSFSTDFGWGSDYELVFSMVIGVFNTITWPIYQGVFWLAVGVIALAIFVATYVGISFRKSDFHLMWPIKVLRTVVNLLVTVLFIPVTTILLSALKMDKDGALARFSSEGVMAWSGMTTVYALVAIAALVIFVPFCMLMGLLNFEFGSRTKDIMARHSSRLDFVYLTVKALLVFVTDLASHLVYLRLYLMLILTGTLVFQVILFVPYYKPVMNYIRTVLLGTLLGASISTVIRVYSPVLKSMELSIALVLHLAISLIFGGLGYLVMYTRIRQNISSTGSVYRLIAAGRKVNTGGANNATPSDVRLSNMRGVQRRPSKPMLKGTSAASARHRQTFSSLNAIQQPATGTKPSKIPMIFRSIYHFYISSQVQLRIMFLQEKSERDSVEVAETVFQHMLTVYPDAVFLRLLYCNFLMSYKNDWIATTTQVRRVKAMAPSFDMRWLIFIMQKQVEREMRSARIGTSKTMGLMTYVDFQHNFGLARKYHSSALKKIRQFWEILLVDNGDLGKIGAAHRTMVKDEKRATQAYSRVLHRFPESPLLWRMYGQYLAEVQNDTENSERAFMLADDFEEKQSKAHTSTFGGARAMTEGMDAPNTSTSVGEVRGKFHRSTSAPESPPPPRMRRNNKSIEEAKDATPVRTGSMSALPEVNESIEAVVSNVTLREAPMMRVASEERPIDTMSDHSSHRGSVHGSHAGSYKTTTNTESSANSSERALKRLRGESTYVNPVIQKMVTRFNITFFILILVVVANYVAILVLVSSRSVSVISAVDLRVHALDAGIGTFELGLHQYVNNTKYYQEEQLNWRILPVGIKGHFDLVLNALKAVELDYHDLFSHAADVQELKDYFATAIVTVTEFENGVRSSHKVHLADAIVGFVTTLRRIALSLANNHFTNEQLRTSDDLHYVVRMSNFEMADITREVLEKYMTAYDNATVMLMYVVIGEGIFAVVALIVIELLVFVPTFTAFHHEKHVRFGLLSLVAKRDIMTMVKKYRDYEAALADAGDDNVANALEEEGIAKDKYSKHGRFRNDQAKQEKYLNEIALARDKVCKEFRQLYVKPLLIMLIVAILFGTQVAITANSLNSDVELMERVTVTRRLENAMGKMFFSGYFYIEDLESMLPNLGIEWDDQFENDMDYYLQYYNGLLYGNESMELGSITSFMTPAREKLYDNQIKPYTSTFIQAYNDLYHSNHSANTYMKPQFGVLQQMWDQPGLLKIPIRQDSLIYNTQLDQNRDMVLTLNDYWLPLLLLVLFTYFIIVFKSIVQQLEEDGRNTMKVLWSLPHETVRSVLPLKSFLLDPEEMMSRLATLAKQTNTENDSAIIKVSDYAERVLESNSVACVVLSNDLKKIAYGNSTVAELFEYDRQAIVGLDRGALIPSVHRTALESAVNEMKSQNKEDKIELRIMGMKNDGTNFPAIVRVHNIVLQRGKLKNRSAVCIEYVKTETTSSSTLNDPTPTMHRELWDLIWKNTPALLIDMNGSIQAMNDSCINLLKVDPKALNTQLLKTLFDESTGDEVWRQVLDATGADASEVMRIRVMLKGEDRSIPARLVLRPVGLGHSNDYRKSIVVIEDLTDSSRVEQRATRVQHERNAVLSTLTTPVMGLDSRGVITFMSTEAAKLLMMEGNGGIGVRVSSIHVGGTDWNTCLGTSGKYSVVLVKGDGSEIALEINCVEYKSGDRRTMLWYLRASE